MQYYSKVSRELRLYLVFWPYSLHIDTFKQSIASLCFYEFLNK